MNSERVRAARPDELIRLQVIQLAAGDSFRGIGMTEIADNPPLSLDVLEGYQGSGRAFVATDVTDDAIGFAVVDVIDGCAHVEQVSVHPDRARRGIGRMLVDHVGLWAADRGLSALTLTTFRAVPWNAPYYARSGFRELGPREITPGLAEVIAAEVLFGLDPATRVCMRRDLG